MTARSAQSARSSRVRSEGSSAATSAGIASARSYQAQQRRAEELAELDRASAQWIERGASSELQVRDWKPVAGFIGASAALVELDRLSWPLRTLKCGVAPKAHVDGILIRSF